MPISHEVGPDVLRHSARLIPLGKFPIIHVLLPPLISIRAVATETLIRKFEISIIKLVYYKLLIALQ